MSEIKVEYRQLNNVIKAYLSGHPSLHGEHDVPLWSTYGNNKTVALYNLISQCREHINLMDISIRAAALNTLSATWQTQPLNERIKAMRITSGLTQSDLATIMDISQQQINKWENGECNPKLTSLKKIAYALSAQIEDLL
jgi:DNA-binding XRE family transcriptional regulator